MTWHYLYILRKDWHRYRAEGWKLCGPMMPLGGYDSVIIRRRVYGEATSAASP